MITVNIPGFPRDDQCYSPYMSTPTPFHPTHRDIVSIRPTLRDAVQVLLEESNDLLEMRIISCDNPDEENEVEARFEAFHEMFDEILDNDMLVRVLELSDDEEGFALLVLIADAERDEQPLIEIADIDLDVLASIREYIEIDGDGLLRISRLGIKVANATADHVRECMGF